MKVAIVGNGYILGQTLSGKEIDSADLVIRVQPRYFDDEVTGNKTDIIAICEGVNDNYKTWDSKKWIFVGDEITTSVNDELCKKYGFNNEYFGYNDALERSMRIVSNARNTDACAPSTGVRALMVALDKYPHYEIKLYGFDFYKNEHSYWFTKGKASGSQHSFRAEEIVIRGLCKTRNVGISETIISNEPRFITAKKPDDISEQHEKPNEKPNVKTTKSRSK